MSENKERKLPEGPLCQSCGMPMENKTDFGTNSDGTGNLKYCHFCFKDGRFTEPDLTMEDMIEKVVGIMMLMKTIPEEQVREVANMFIPELERWSEKNPGKFSA